RQIATLLFPAGRKQFSASDTAQVQAILAALQKGRIDRGLFTANANSYFGDTALRDCRASLASLGKLQLVTAVSEGLRGGMTHRRYRARFARKTVSLNVYALSDGKYEQFLVEDEL